MSMKTNTLKEAVDELIRWERHFGLSGQSKENTIELRRYYITLANELNRHVKELKVLVETAQQIPKVLK